MCIEGKIHQLIYLGSSVLADGCREIDTRSRIAMDKPAFMNKNREVS